MSPSTELISIIIPAYNSGLYIGRCLDSVTAAIDANCEVVVVNDGSTDDTAAIVRSYAERDRRIEFIELEKHIGPGAARKAGVDYAQGDSVLFMDADDTMPAKAIAELRSVNDPDADIVAGNMAILMSDGSRQLTLSGSKREYGGIEYAERIMTGLDDYHLIGKKFRKSLFEKFHWDVNPLYGGLYHRVLHIQLACAASKVVLVSGIHVYNYVRRPWSLSSMMFVRNQGLVRLWQIVSSQPVSQLALLKFGLHFMDKVFIQRGIPFENDFQPAVELRNMLRHEKVDDYERHIGRLLKSRRLRLREGRRLAREGKLTMQAPHLAFIIISHNNARRVERSVNSIYDTGFRNIQIVIVDNASDHQNSLELNRLAIFNPRVTVVKQTKRRDDSAARIVGVRSANALAVMFVDAGDTIVAEGVLDALNHVDTGSDLSFLGIRFNNFSGFGTTRFDPTKCTPIHDGAQIAFESVASCGTMLPCIHGVIIRRQFLLDNRDKFNGTDSGMAYKTLVMLNMLTLNPRLSAVASTGYIRHAGGYEKCYDQCLRYYKVGQNILQLADNMKLNEPGRMRDIGAGITSLVQHLLARLVAVPVLGRARTRKVISKLMKLPEVEEFYRHAGMPLPDASDLVVKARAYYRRHRWHLLHCLFHSVTKA